MIQLQLMACSRAYYHTEPIPEDWFLLQCSHFWYCGEDSSKVFCRNQGVECSTTEVLPPQSCLPCGSCSHYSLTSVPHPQCSLWWGGGGITCLPLIHYQSAPWHAMSDNDQTTILLSYRHHFPSAAITINCTFQEHKGLV